MAQNKKDLQNVAYMTELFERYQSATQKRLEEWRYYYKITRAADDVAIKGYKYEVNRRIALMFVETFSSVTLNPLFQMRELVSIQPQERFSYNGMIRGDTALSRQLGMAVNKLMSDPRNRFRKAIKDHVKSLGYYGNGNSQLLPRFMMRNGKRKYMGPKCDLLQVYDFFPNPFRREMMEGTDLFVREDIIPSELKRREMQWGYKNVKEALRVGGETTVSPKWDLDQRAQQAYRGSDGPDRLISLVHYFDSMNNLRIMANNETLLFNSAEARNQRMGGGGQVRMNPGPVMPYYPFFSTRINESPGEFYGTGIAALSAEAQVGINRRASQRNETIELNIWPPLFIDSHSGIDKTDLRLWPGKMIEIQKGTNVQPYTITDTMRQAYQEDDAEMRHTEQIVSIPESVRGVSPKTRTTATQNTQNLQAALERMSTLQQDLVEMILQMAIAVAIQIRTYMDQADYERLTGHPDVGFYKLPFDEIVDMLDFKVKYRPLSQQERTMREQRLVTLLQSGAGMPFVNPEKLWTRIVEEMFPDEPGDQFNMTPQEMMMKQMEMQQAMMMGLGGGDIPPHGSPGGGGPGGSGLAVPGGGQPPPTPQSATGEYKTNNPGQTIQNMIERGNA